jgi:prevent-host-death family protein
LTRMSASQIREEFAEALNRVVYKGERIVLRRRGKDVAALVSMEDLELLQAAENREDLRDARAAKAEAERKGTTPLADFKKELGL